MPSYVRYSFLFLVSTLFLTTGCARNRQTREQVNMLHSQVISLTNEVARLNDDNQSLREEVRSLDSHHQQLISRMSSSGTREGVVSSARRIARNASEGSATVNNGIYRTPSGFELQATAIQTALRGAGYYNGTVDGKIGPQTEEAVRRFQRENGLEPDGIVGRKTWEQLQSFAH